MVVVNLRDQLEPVPFFTACQTFSAEESVKYFDTTRLNAEGR
jgi:hypothetical protein